MKRIKTKIQGITASHTTPNKRNPHLTKEKKHPLEKQYDKNQNNTETINPRWFIQQVQ